MRQGSWTRRIWEDFSEAFDSRRKSITISHDVETPFGELLTVNRTPIIELNSSYGFSALRDAKVETSGGTVVSDGVEFLVSSGVTPNGFAQLGSAEVGRYIPGYSAELGIGIRVPTLPTGNQYAQWGGFGATSGNGVYFGVDATGYYVAVLKDSVETKVYQDEWNIDSLDGLGASGYSINDSNGRIFQIDFTWYGYGPIVFSVVGTVDGTTRIIKCHSFSGFDSTSVDSPNFRVVAQTGNGGDASDYRVYCGGRQYSILGNYVPKFRYTGDFRGSVSTTTTVKPLVSFRRKEGFGDRSITLQGFTSLAVSEPHIIEARISGTLTGASYGTPTNHTATETALESDTQATAITGGIVIWQEVVAAGQGNQQVFSDRSVDFDVPDGEIITLCARTLTGTGSVISDLRMREEW